MSEQDDPSKEVIVTVDKGCLMLTIRSLKAAITRFGMVNAGEKSLVV